MTVKSCVGDQNGAAAAQAEHVTDQRASGHVNAA